MWVGTEALRCGNSQENYALYFSWCLATQLLRSFRFEGTTQAAWAPTAAGLQTRLVSKYHAMDS